MRRDPALQDLSRDHFLISNQVLRVRRVVQAEGHAEPEATVRSGFLDLVRRVLPPHFQEEEELLLPCLHGPARRGHAERLRDEHDALRGRFAALTEETPLTRVWEVAQALQAHVRWEEADLFQSLQSWMGPEALGRLAARDAAFRREAGLPVGPNR